MSHIVELVKEWVKFTDNRPQGNVKEFCEGFLQKSKKDVDSDTEQCLSELQHIYSLTRMINRLSKLWMYFTLNAMKPMGLTSFDEFAFLYNTDQNDSIRKKDLIQTQFLEISSGLLVIDRLIKKGFLQERTDDFDKRSKQVSLTKKGKLTLQKCQIAVGHVAQDLYGAMPGEDLASCIEFLSPIEKNITQKWHKIKR